MLDLVAHPPYHIAMDEQQVNPRLLGVFRLYIAMRVGFLALTGLFFYAQGGDLLEPEYAPYVTLFVIDVAFLVVFLYWPWLQAHLGRAYLPLALAVSAIVPLSEANYLYEFYGQVDVARLWIVVPFLVVPLILTAWQYTYREVIWYSLGTAAYELTTIVVNPSRSLSIWSDVAMILARTALFVLVGYIVSILVEAMRSQSHELAKANRQLVRYAATLEQLTISRERNRMARELHDTLAHTLSGLAVQLEAAETLWPDAPPRVRDMLDTALATTRAGLDDTRRTLGALRASPLEDLGLGMAVAHLAREETARYGLEAVVDVSPDLHQHPAEVEQCFYRVAQEALANTIQHAEARKVLVSLHQQGSILELTLSDDGQGFAVDEAPPDYRFGLRGMRERAEMIGAQLEIVSQPGAGTTITMRHRERDV